MRLHIIQFNIRCCWQSREIGRSFVGALFDILSGFLGKLRPVNSRQFSSDIPAKVYTLLHSQLRKAISSIVKSNQLFNAFWQCLDERHSDIPHLDTCALLIPWENNETTHPSNLTGKAKSKITISSKFLAYRIKSLHVTESRCKRHLKLSLKTYIYIERRTPKSRTDRIRYLPERSRYEKFSKGLSGKVKTC